MSVGINQKKEPQCYQCIGSGRPMKLRRKKSDLRSQLNQIQEITQ